MNPIARPIARVDVLGVGISAINMAMAIAEIRRWIDEGERHYVCVTGVHGVIESQDDPELLRIHNDSGLTTPDGMPMVWSARCAGAVHVDRVYGPDLMLEMCRQSEIEGWSCFLYGGKDGVPELLAERLTAQFPKLRIAGTYSPPFRELDDDEQADIVDRINASGADLVWVGLSTPKQERWIAAHVDKLEATALFGVGAAFDFHAGLLPQAPHWMQRCGLEWFYRLCREPRRLWRRYLRNNPRFVWGVLFRRPHLRTN